MDLQNAQYLASSTHTVSYPPACLQYCFPSRRPSGMSTTIEINDGVFCSHLKEVVCDLLCIVRIITLPDYRLQCADCGADYREDNDAFYGWTLFTMKTQTKTHAAIFLTPTLNVRGVDTIDCDGLEAPPSTASEDGVYRCNEHASTGQQNPSVFFRSRWWLFVDRL